MIGFIRSTAAIPYGYIRRQQPAVREILAEPATPEPAQREHIQAERDRATAAWLTRAMAPQSALGPPSDQPPIELREAGWPVRIRHELEDLADLTRVHGSWKAAQLMNWRR